MVHDQELHQSSPNMSSDFTFAFDDPAFSDRTLKLLIFDDTREETSNNGSTELSKLNDLLMTIKQRKEEICESPKKYRVKSLNISSLILAAGSSFFRKLFLNGMKESEQHEVTLRIHSCEEAPHIDMFKFMYNKNLMSANTPTTLIEVLLAADKYDVPSCVNYCCQLLVSFPLTAELALFYIDLPSIISKGLIQPLLEAAKDFLPLIFKDISKYHEDILNLSLDGIKLILSHDDLKVDSEDEAYDLFMEWLKKHFPDDTSERFRVLRVEMPHLIRLQCMTLKKLVHVIVDELSKSKNLALGVLPVMVKAILDDSKPSLPRYRRAYKLLPTAVVSFEIPYRQCLVYLDLKREECGDLEENQMLRSQTFILDENVFCLGVGRKKHKTLSYCVLGVVLIKSRNGPVKAKYEVAVRLKSSPEVFERRDVRRSFLQKVRDGAVMANLVSHGMLPSLKITDFS